MKASVNFNSDGEPYNLVVSERDGHRVLFNMDGSTAVAREASPPEGSNVSIRIVIEFMEFAETLPFVQSVTFESVDDESGVRLSELMG